jgi:hypothetical protein
MAILSGQLDPSFTRRYWELVSHCLTDIFDKRLDVKPLEGEIAKLPLEEQALFFHAEPYDVAGDLAGVSGDTLNDLAKKYDALARQFGWWPKT